MRVVARTETINQAVIVTVQVPMLSRSLVFRSDWTTARKSSYRWVLDGLEPSSSHLIHIAGRNEPVIADESGTAIFVWDGLDANKSNLGPAIATAQVGGVDRKIRLGSWDPRSVGLGGLMISGYDHLDSEARRIHSATGRNRGNVALRATDHGFDVSRESGRLIGQFDPNGFLRAVVDSRSRQTLASYERTDGGLAKTSRGAHQIAVVRQGSLTKLITNGWTLRLLTDESGRVTELIDPSERGVRFAYSQAGLLTEVSDASEFTYSFDFDEDGRLVGVTEPGRGKVELVRSASEFGHRVTAISAEGRESLQQVERLADGTKVRTSKCCGNHPAVTRIQGGRIEMNRPDGSRAVTNKTSGRRDVVLPSGLTHVRTVQGDEVTVNGNTFRVSHDEHGVTSTSPMGRVFEVATSGNTVTVRRPDGAMEMTKDDRGQVTRLRWGELTLDMEYDDSGLIAGARGSDGSTTRFEHDRTGWLIAQHLSDQRVVRLDRDGAGLVRKVITPDGSETTFDFDSPVRLSSVRFPSEDGSEDRIDYRYDRDGLLVSSQVSGKAPINLGRGAGGDIESISGGDSSVAIKYDYDNGRPVRGTSADGQVTSFTFDGDLVTGIAHQGRVNGSISYQYDEGFRRSKISSGGLAANIRYDADGQVSSVGEAEIERDEAGRMVAIAAGVVRQTFTHAPDGQVARMAVSVGDREIWSVEYTYDRQRRIASMIDSSGSGPVELSYDGDGRLASAEGFEAAYTPNGSPATLKRDGAVVEAATAPGDRLLAFGPWTVSYGPGGVVEAIGDMTLAWDDLGVAVSIAGGGTNTTLLRDAFGYLIGIDHGDGTSVGFVSGPHGRPEAVLDSDGTLRAMLAGGTRSDSPLLAIEPNRTLFLASDHVGSIRRVIDTATGEVVESRDYDLWGALVGYSGSSPIPYGFGGGIDDGVNGLVHFPARTYSPALMRWLSRDPRLFRGGSANLYAYCNNDPVNYRDPSGTIVEICRSAADLPIPDFLIPGAEHWWIRTTNEEAGMVDGQNGVGVGDHSGRGDQPGVQCDPVDDVDEPCVEAQMQLPKTTPAGFRYGKGLGTYGPGNTCQNWVDKVLSSCSEGRLYSVQTNDPDAYDNWYGPDVAGYTPAGTHTPDPGQSMLDGGSLWE